MMHYGFLKPNSLCMKRILLFFFFLFAFLHLPTTLLHAQQKTMCIPPDIFPSANVTICNGQSTTISVTHTSTSGPYIYLWTPSTGLSNPNISNPVASPTTTTTYTVTVTDAQPCTSLPGFVTVTVNSTPTVSISGAGSICMGGSATLTGSGGSTYSWSTGSTSNPITVNPTTATTYTVWGTNAAGCSNTSTGTVNVNSPPAISISGAASSICNGSSATLTGIGGSTYSWSTGSTSNPITVNPTTSTTYTVWGTDAAGCSNTDIATVNVNSLPTISISGGGISICSGNGAFLTASGGDTYLWSTGATTTGIFVSPTVATTYTVTGTDAATGCSNTATSTVSMYPNAVASISGTTTICNGQSTTLCASGGVTFQWDSGPTTSCITVSPTSSTGYTVTVVDGNGCTDDDAATVTVNPLPTANAGPDVSICIPSSTTLTATGNGTFLWSPSTGLSCTTCANPTANPTVTTTYTVTVTNSCGSTDDSVTVTITSSASVNAGSDVTICQGNSTTLIASGSGTYNWSPSTGLSNTTIANPVATPTVSTNYTVTITTGCGSAEDSVWVVVDVPVASISGTSTICSGQSSTLCATGGGTYLWDSGQTTSCITVSPTSANGYTVTVTDAFLCTASASTTVSVNALPVVAISGNTSVCSGVNDTLVATGGPGYLWNTGATTDTLIVNLTSATGYTVTVTDGNGCSNSANISVSVNPQPSANAGTDATICNGTSTTLCGTGNGSVVWNPGGQTTSCIVANPSSTITYTFSVTNSCGTADDSVVVNVNALPSAAINGNATICAGSSDTLVATGGGTYVWNPTASTNDSLIVSPTSATGYTVTVTDANLCSNTATFTVNVSSVTASISGSPLAICSGNNSTLTASGGGTYLWNTSATTASITVSPTITTIYTVTVTNSNGCTAVDTETITVTAQPTASITATSSTICSGSSTTLTANGGSNYSWSTGQPVQVIVVNPTASATYTAFVSNGACMDTAIVSVTVNPAPTASVTTTSGIICIGGCATLSASGGISYSWSTTPIQTTATIVECPTIATGYTVTVTDASGCTANASTLINVLSTVTVTVNPAGASICAGDQVTLQAQGGVNYTWLPGGQTTSSIPVSPNASTTYTVIGSNTCSADTATVIVNVSALATADASASPYTINIGNQTTLNGVTSNGTYNWSWESSTAPLSCSTCQFPVANPTATTTYTLCITDASGCTACDTVTVNVMLECEEIFVPSAFSPNGDTKNDFVTVRTPCIETIDFTIYNRWGQVVYHTDDIGIVNKSNDGWDGTFKGKECDPAVYFYILNVSLIPDSTFKTIQGNVSLIR